VKGFKFAVPFDYSMHNFLCATTWPSTASIRNADIQIRVVPPPEMVANLRAGNIDGSSVRPLQPARGLRRGGFIHILSKDIWNGHPCCAFGVPEAMIREAPNTFAALYRAVLTAAAHGARPQHRALIAQVIAPPII